MSALIRKSGQSHQRFLSARLVVETNQRHKRPSIQGYMLDLDWHEDVTAPRTDPNICHAFGNSRQEHSLFPAPAFKIRSPECYSQETEWFFG